MAGAESPGAQPRPGKGKGKEPAKKEEPKPVKGDGIAVEKTLKKRRVDDFHSGFVDLVTDRVKIDWFSIVAILLFPAILLNLLIVRRISHVPDHWLDQRPAKMAILAAPTDLVLGVKSRASGRPLTVIATNKDSLPTVDCQVKVSFVSMEPDADFDFCAGIVRGSNLDERLGGVCTTRFADFEQDTDVSGIAVLEDFALIGGVPGTYVLNVTVSKVQDYVDEFGREGTGPVIGAHAWFQVKVHRNLNMTITPTSRPPQAIEYATIFNGRGTVCSAPADGGDAICAEGERKDLQPPGASLHYAGGDQLSNMTKVTFFVIANFSEVLWKYVEFPRTNHPHHTGSVDRMARITSSQGDAQLMEQIAGYDGGTGMSPLDDGSGWGGTVEFAGFRVLGANNPSLFFAFYCSGVFGVWNENWVYEFPGNEADGRPPASIQQVVEMTMLPRRDAKGIRPAEGEWWVGGQAPADLGDDGVATGDQAYLTQIEIIDQPTDVVEGTEFVLQLNTYAYIYPRNRKKFYFVSGVYIFAEAVPIHGVRATNRKDFQSRRKVLLNAVSSPTTEESSFFQNLAFSEWGDEGTYRIRVFAEGHWHFDSAPITVRTKINLVMLRLPASVQMKWPGCDSFMTLPPTDENGDGNPDSDFPKSQEMAMCFEAHPFVPITDLPYVEAYVCTTTVAQEEGAVPELKIDSLGQSCNKIKGKSMRVTINSASWDPFSNDESGERIWDWPKMKTDITRDRDVTELPAVSYQQKFPVAEPRHELSSLTINNMFKKSMFVSFSVGGVSSTIKFAVAMNDTSALTGALTTCMGEFVPVAYLEVLDEKEVNLDAPPPVSTVFPGYTHKWRVFAADMYGNPAKDRPICLRIFELDWRDYFADRVKFHDDNMQLRYEQTDKRAGFEHAQFATLDNFTYYNTTCWLTNSKGIAYAEHYWDSQEVKFRHGAFAYYFETAEWEDGSIYKRGVKRYTERARWKGKGEERECLASFGFQVPNIQTDSYYAYIRHSWSDTPTAVYGTARWPHPKPLDLVSFFPQHATYYSSTDIRTVRAREYHSIFVRAYQGTALSDFGEGSSGMYPKGIVMTSFIIDAPPNFPASKQKCPLDAPKTVTDCWHGTDREGGDGDMALTFRAITDDYGYGTFSFMATEKYLGRFTILVAVGDSGLGTYSRDGAGANANQFTQTFHIEVVPFKGLSNCKEVDSTLQAKTPSLAPYLKYYHTCPFRNPDGSCSWNTELCPTSASASLVVLNDNFLGEPAPACIPLGTVLPNPVTARVQNDMGEPVAGHSLHLQGGAGSESLTLHPALTQPSDVAGLASANNVILDYAEPGAHKLRLKLQLDGSPFEASSLDSKAFTITDEVVATFVQQPSASVIIGSVVAPHVAVRLR